MDSNYQDIATAHFKKYDKDKSNFIDLGELKSLMTDIAKEINFPAPEDSEIQETLKEYDANQDKRISLDEFMKLFEVLYQMKMNK
jgi:Ca2+-binding EF-hand superfamily protein